MLCTRSTAICLLRLLDYEREWLDRYYSPDGRLMGTRVYDEEVHSEWEWCSSLSSRGREDAGLWTPGVYRVEILIDGVEFARGSFTIE